MLDRVTAKIPLISPIPGMSRLSFRPRISHKIAAIGAVGILGLMLVGGIYLVGNSSQDHFRKAASDARDVHAQVNKLNAKIIDARSIEKDFLLQADEQLVKRHKEMTKAVDADFDALLKMIQSAGLDDLSGNVATARSGFKNYADRFDGLAGHRIKLGLSENLGLEGALRKSVHGVETKLKEFEQPQLANIMLMMRRHEKDFMLRRNVRYGKEIKTRASEFTTALVATDIPPADKADITKKLADYQRDFFAWMDAAVTIGNEQRAIADEYAAVEPSLQIMKDTIDKVYVRAAADAAVSQAETLLWMQISILVIILGVAALSFLIGRAVSKPLTAMGGVMRKLSAGDNTVDVPFMSRRDEIGGMANAVQSFKEAAIEKLQLEGMTAQQRKAADDERLRNEAAQAHAAKEQAHVVRAIAQGLESLSQGDLTCRVEDEFPPAYQQLKDDFNAAMGELHETVTTIVRTAHGIQSNTSELSNATDDLSKRTEQQAASLEETAAAVDQITATVRKTADGANHAKHIVSKAKTDAELSGDVVRRAIEAMTAIEGSAKQISQILGVMDEIAFQTNLLALNAGVEAARAGEAGRGFAVVASEVRSLAQRSAEAAKEIKGLIAASSAQVDGGVKLVSQTGQALDQIVKQVTEINGVVGEIAASAHEQATGLGQVNTAVNQMDQVTQQNAAMVEESTAASHALAGEAQKLADLISRFNVGHVSAEAATEPARAKAAATPPHKAVPQKTNGLRSLLQRAKPAAKPNGSSMPVAATRGANALALNTQPAAEQGREEF